jgi:hemoglobin-like flavoprotein
MSHYRTAHEAFMETIEFTLADNATPKILKSWDMALSLVIDGMKRGAN